MEKEKQGTQIGNITIYNLNELSIKLNVTKITLRTYLRKGKLKGQKVGVQWFVTEESLKSFLNGDKN